MKKLSALFLFFLMLLCSSGFYVAFHIKTYSIRQTQRKIILSSEIRNRFQHEFVFSKDEIENGKIDIIFKEKDEIKYKGKMYDIISQKSDLDSLHILCISDREEDFTLALSQNEIIKTQKAKDAKDLSELKFKLSNFIFERDSTPVTIGVYLDKLQFSVAREKLPHPFIHTIFSPPWC